MNSLQSSGIAATPNPLHQLSYEPVLEGLGEEFFDRVPAARFPDHKLRWRNDDLLPTLGLEPESVSDRHFIDAFALFDAPQPCLALRYHGYQFGEYNPRLGDGRGFLYGQVRGVDGELYDFGTKGSGPTPYSRGGDGRLTLKGGVREVLAAEALHRLGVTTSRCLSMIETGESLWREDEPSPTRSSVMVRLSRSHIRFGTFERLHHIHRPDLAQQLLDHVITTYYPEIDGISDSQVPEELRQDIYSQFYLALVERVAQMAAQWMIAGFCHGVLNTDNMSITGESFDYGPYAFIETYDPKFTAAYFDHWGRYSFANQATICRLNLEVLQKSFSEIIPPGDMEVALAQFDSFYSAHYRQLMLKKLGLETLEIPLVEAIELVRITVELLEALPVRYQTFFHYLTEDFNDSWCESSEVILGQKLPELFDSEADDVGRDVRALFSVWRQCYHRQLQTLTPEHLTKMTIRLGKQTPKTILWRSQIEAIWEPIATQDNWAPFNGLVHQLQQGR